MLTRKVKVLIFMRPIIATSVRHFDARIPTENNRFQRVFCRNKSSACRNVDARISTKIIDFGVFFCRNYLRCVEMSMLEFRRKSEILACFLPQLPAVCRNVDARISTKRSRTEDLGWCARPRTTPAYSARTTNPRNPRRVLVFLGGRQCVRNLLSKTQAFLR